MLKNKTERRTPGGREQPLRSPRRTAIRLLQFMSPWKRRLAGLFLVSGCSILCDLAMPLVIAHCIDVITVLHGDYAKQLSQGLVLFTGLLLLSATLEYTQGLLNAGIAVNVEKSLRCSLFKKILHLPVERIERLRQGDLMSRIYSDVRLASTAYSEAVVSLICSILVIMGCLIIMFQKSVELAIVTVSAALFSLAATFFVSGCLLPRIMAQQEALGAVNVHVSESLATFRSSVEGNRLEYDMRRMREKNRAYYLARMCVCRIEGLVEPLMLLLGNLTFLLIVVRGAALAIRGDITLGTIQVFVLYFKQFMEPVNGLGECWIQIQSALSGAERVFDILDNESEKSAAVPALQSVSESFLRFDQVRFGYRKNLPVLKGVDLHVQRGQRVAVVGKTGTGKTTMFNLLERFYTQYSGGIFLEGVEIRQIPLQELRNRITAIPQDPQLLNGTVFENLTYGMDDVSAQEVYLAAEMLGAADFIKTLPEGYDTVIPPDGAAFSQGQLQLVCLVRAFLRGRDLLLMDEATSSLDTATEARLQAAMEKMMEGRTSITIAHRLSTIVHADQICVMKDGQICETGTHQELMKLRGNYYDLFISQYWGKEI